MLFVDMANQVGDIIEILAELCEHRDLKAAITHSVKGGLVTGVSAIIAGLLFGPVGLALGGLVGGAGSAIALKDQFIPVAKIIRSMTPDQKLKLKTKVVKALQKVMYNDVGKIAGLLLCSSSLQEIALREVANYLRSEMNLRIA